MKVLFINTNENYGGAARAAYRIMRGVQQYGVETQMFVKYMNSQAEDVIPLARFVPTNLLYRVCDWVAAKFKNKWYHYKWHPYKRTKLNDFMSDLRGMSSRGALNKLDYDIVHLHWINNRFLDIDELKKIKKPIVWTLHDSWPFCGVCHYFLRCEKYQIHCGACPMLGSKKEKDLAYEVFEKKLDAYKDLDLHIVTPSRWLGDSVRRSALFGRFPLTIIPNCIDTKVFHPLDNNEMNKSIESQTNMMVKSILKEAVQDKRNKKPIILYGAVQAATNMRKGLLNLLAATRYLDSIGYEAKILVFGADKQELNMQFEHLSVSFVGYVGNTELLRILYSIADVMVVPSHTENLSNVIMESLSCGTPVVAFNIGGNGDMIDHMENGYLAKELDSEDLAKGILWCIANNKDGLLSKNAREKVLNNFTIPIVSEKYKQLYQSLV